MDEHVAHTDSSLQASSSDSAAAAASQLQILAHEMDSYRLAAIIESADDAIISKNLDGIITSWNKGAERIFGYTEEEMIGKPVLTLIPPDHHDEEPQILSRLRRGEKIEHYETVRARKDGQLINVSLTVSPIRAADGTVVGASKIARDVTEQKKAQERLQQALAEAQEAKRHAEEANRIKDDFLTTISHELRTPLTSIVGWVTMLRGGRLDEVMAHKALETIDRNVKAQAQLVEDLLDISRIVSGKMHIVPKPLNLSSIIHSAVDSVMPAAQAKGIRFQVVLDPSTGTVNGDPDRLQQVIWNLLSNAIKFTPAGGRVQIQMEGVKDQVEITVSDSGIGVTPEFLPHVFDRFAQEDSSGTRSYGGLGMGLSIVKYIAELHGGTIRAFSEGTGKGSSFTLALPLLQTAPNLSAGQHFKTELPRDVMSELPSELRGLKLLVVDDELDTCEMISAAFEQCGSRVTTATSASQALSQMAEYKPDILIADINMPQMDGYQLIQLIREREPENQGRIPAIALTALARIEDRGKALAAGYQMHVAKPVELNELYAVVSSLASVVARNKLV